VTDAPQGKPAVLVVDDEAPIRHAIARYLDIAGYEPTEAADGERALAVLRERPFAAALVDVRMPGMSGIEVLPLALARDADLAVIMLTGVGDPQLAIQCLKNGAADYLIKPVELEELGIALAYALRKRQLEIERRDMERWLAAEVERQTAQLEAQQRRIEHLSLSVLGALVAALEPTGPVGRTHSIRVAQLAGHVASALGLDANSVGAIQTAGRIHDIGRLALRDDATLPHAAAPELVTGRHDTELAMRLLDPLRHHPAVLEIVRCQHERWDGRGPLGLRGAAIPVGARILAAVNLYDELVAPAAGAAGLAPADALANLAGLAGTLLDREVLEALRGVVTGGAAADRA
jgi:response regulator RpfG family c-di-GMP phosphodiesterase